MHLAASKLVVLSILLSLAAFILSLICVLAGTKPGSLENVNLLTVSHLPKAAILDANVLSLVKYVDARSYRCRH